jgi:hypothetical protein
MGAPPVAVVRVENGINVGIQVIAPLFPGVVKWCLGLVPFSHCATLIRLVAACQQTRDAEMKLSRYSLLVTKVIAGALFSGLAHAGYFQWEAVTAPTASGATCGNGTPYRFFVNRTPLTSKTVIMFEGGGACWDGAACKGGSVLAAVNPDGVPSNYMTDFKRQAKLGLVTPFTARIHPLQAVKTQTWNIVYVPYCTGDVQTGNRTVVYNPADPAKAFAFEHKGLPNMKYVASWMSSNMGAPEQLLVTGFSAGGVASSVHYPTFREALRPRKSALLSDGGPLMVALRNGDPAQYPSVLLHNKIREAWGLDDANGMITQIVAKYPGLIDPNNLATLQGNLGKLFPNDRFGYSLFQEDGIFSAFSYQKFFPEIANAPTEQQRLKLLNQKWRQDLKPWLTALTTYPNVGYYIPNWRKFKQAHCATILTFGGSSIAERGYQSIGSFVDNLLDGTGPVLRAQEFNPPPWRIYPSDVAADLLADLLPV